MKLAFKIAFRYFKSRKKKSFISIISNLSMVGVAVGTMALVVVLSVFNGLEELNRQLFRSFDPDIKISPATGKRFELNPVMFSKIKQIEGIKFITEVIEDNALARYGDLQAVIKLKGVDSTFLLRHQLDTAMVEGRFLLNADGEPKAIIGGTVQGQLRVMVEDNFRPFELWYPRSGKTLNLNSPNAFNQQLIKVGGVYSLESNLDNYVIAPLGFVSQLLEYKNQRTTLEIQLISESYSEKTKEKLQELLGSKFTVLTRDEQNADLLRAIRIEKLFVTIALAFIMLVAAINIFFSLSMTILEKKEDIKMFFAMGATPALIKQIFLLEGIIVAFTGATIGLILGVVLCWLQDSYGLVTMQLSNAITNSYPVKMIGQDFIMTGLVVVFITTIVSYLPAARAAKMR